MDAKERAIRLEGSEPRLPEEYGGLVSDVRLADLLSENRNEAFHSFSERRHDRVARCPTFSTRSEACPNPAGEASAVAGEVEIYIDVHGGKTPFEDFSYLNHRHLPHEAVRGMEAKHLLHELIPAKCRLSREARITEIESVR